jgi:hypothetical protein
MQLAIDVFIETMLNRELWLILGIATVVFIYTEWKERN